MKKSKLLLAVLLAFSLSPHADNINLTPTGGSANLHAKFAKKSTEINGAAIRAAAGEYRFLINPAAPSQMIGFCDVPYEWNNASYQTSGIDSTAFYGFSDAIDIANLQSLLSYTNDPLALLQQVFQNNLSIARLNLPDNNLQTFSAVNTFLSASGNPIAPIAFNVPPFSGGGTQNYLPTSPASVPALPAMPLMASVLIGYGVIRRRIV